MTVLLTRAQISALNGLRKSAPAFMVDQVTGFPEASLAVVVQAPDGRRWEITPEGACQRLEVAHGS